ncbi:hypothetical protein ACFLQL_01555 [Verrucomicrobiota bacterium]
MIIVRDKYLSSVLHSVIKEASTLLYNSALEFKPFYDTVYNKNKKESITLTKEESRLYGTKKQI